MCYSSKYLVFRVVISSAIAYYAIFSYRFSPFSSCLDRDHASSKNMKKLLLLVSVAHKYSALAIERRAITLLSELVTPRTVRSHLGPSIPDSTGNLRARLDDPMKFKLAIMDALELCVVAKCDEMGTIIRTAICEDVWASDIPAYAAFCAGERIGDVIIIGTACYMLMRKYASCESLAQADLPKLSSVRRDAIEQARARHVSEWDSIADAWGRFPIDGPDFGPCWSGHDHKLDSNDFLSRTWRQISAEKAPSFDVLHRIRLAKKIALRSAVDSRTNVACKPCCIEIHEYFDQSTSKIIDALGSAFATESHPSKGK